LVYRPAGQDARQRGAFTGLVWWPRLKYYLHSEPLKSLEAIHHIIIARTLDSQCSGNLTSYMQLQVCVTVLLAFKFFVLFFVLEKGVNIEYQLLEIKFHRKL